jgi:transposase
VFGVDLGKNVFHVVGLAERGAIIQCVKFRRDALLTFFERATRTVVGMEACPGPASTCRPARSGPGPADCRLLQRLVERP